MIDWFNILLIRWWRGLLRPWTNHKCEQHIVALRDGELIPEGKPGADQGRNWALRVPKDMILSSPVSQSSLKKSNNESSVAELIADALPFSASELHYVIKENTLLAVLKKDLIDVRALSNEQGRPIEKLLLSDGQTSGMLNLQAETLSRKPLMVLPMAGGILITFLFLVFHYQKNTINNQQRLIAKEIATIKNVFSETKLEHRGPEPGVSNLNVYRALKAIESNLPNDAEIGQLNVVNSNGNVTIVIDAQARSAAEVLAQLDQDRRLNNTEFISAISTSGSDSKERFRIRTEFSFVAEQAGAAK